MNVCGKKMTVKTITVRTIIIITKPETKNKRYLLKENLDNGRLGKIISARVVLTWCKPDEYYSLSDWKGTWDKEGGKDYWGFQHIRQIADFYDAVEKDREPFISGREALKIQKLICEIYDKGRW